MPQRTAVAVMLTALLAYAGGWYSHQALQPFLPGAPSVHAGSAEPGALSSRARVIYTAPDDGNHRLQPMRVDQITVLQETSDSLLLELQYVYEGPAPAQEVKLFVGLDSNFLYLGNDQVHQGKGRMRVNIGLIDTDMRAKGVRRFDTHQLRVSFEHYAPEAYKGVLATTVLPFAKSWALPEATAS